MYGFHMGFNTLLWLRPKLNSNKFQGIIQRVDFFITFSYDMNFCFIIGVELSIDSDFLVSTISRPNRYWGSRFSRLSILSILIKKRRFLIFKFIKSSFLNFNYEELLILLLFCICIDKM
jgi:hypothetical protein